MQELATRAGVWLLGTLRPLSRYARAVVQVNSKAFVTDMLLVGAVCALLWVGIWTLLEQQRKDLLRDAAEDTANLAQASEQNTLRTLDAIDRTLLLLRSAYVTNGDHLDLASWKRQAEGLAPDALTFQLSIVDATGKLRASSLGPLRATVDLSDREHFLVQRSSKGDNLLISKPIVGRESGRWSLQFTRKILQANGSFNGLVVISVDPFELARLYTPLDLGRGSALLAGFDGVVRAESMEGTAAFGRNIGPAHLLTAAKATPKGTLRVRDPDGRMQIVSFRRLDRYKLVLAVGVNRDEALKSYTRSRAEYVGGGGLLTVLILLVGGSAVRRNQTLLRSQRVLTDTLEHMSQGIFMVDSDRRIAVINRRAIELLGLPPNLINAGSSFDDLLKWQLENAEFEDNEAVRRLAESGGLEITDSVYERTRPNGTALEVRSRRLSEGRAVRTFTDVTERKRAEAQISFLAHHDGLTGLANRRSFQVRLEQAISLGRRSGTSFAVLCLDLDRFKYVNDSRGHDVGDLLLQSVAKRLLSTVREGDTVTRFGGDEFAVLMADVGQPAEAAALAERLIVSLAAPYDLRAAQVMIGASVGIALFPADGLTAEQLLKSADIALYSAKESGRGTFRFFEPEMDIRLQERCALERAFSEALAAGQIEVQFQPICDINTRQPVSYEALARWTDPQRGAVPPAVFIPLAEETGLITALGRFMLHAACQEAVTWPPWMRLSVNLSHAQLIEPDLVQQICDCLHQTGLEPRRLDIEVTEALLIRNGDVALDVIRELRGAGVRVYLDDFGTGHAGLTYLLRFPFDGVKIDCSIVMNVAVDAPSQAIVCAAMLLSKSLHLEVIAEGVETEAQLESLRLLGCQQLQGFLLGRPLPSDGIVPIRSRPDTTHQPSVP